MQKSKTTVQIQNQLRDQTRVHEAKAIVLTCMDFRLIDDMIKMMNELGYNNNYDQFILAGASLGYNKGETPVQKSCTDKYCKCSTSYWKPIFKNHINLASKLHEISEIIIIDHYNCGAYRLMGQKLKNNATESEQLIAHKLELDEAKNNLYQFVEKLKNQITLDMQTLGKTTLEENKIELEKMNKQLKNLCNLKIRLFMMKIDGSYKEIDKSIQRKK